MDITAIAKQLRETRLKIEQKKEELEKELSPLEAERDAYQLALLEGLKAQGMASIKLETGETYSKSSRKGIEVVLEPQALKWAMENMAVSIDRRIVAQKLKGVEEIPSCFKVVETEYISIRSPKEI